MTNLLFRNDDLGSVLTQQDQKLSNEVASLSEERVLNTSPEDLCNYLVDKYAVEAAQIDESGINADYGDAKVDVSQRF